MFARLGAWGAGMSQRGGGCLITGRFLFRAEVWGLAAAGAHLEMEWRLDS